MEKGKFKEFKNYLLSSGIPLEVYISNLLAKHGWIILEEEPFYIENPITGEVEGSITEIIGRDPETFLDKRKEIPGIHFDVNVECKYRNPSISWTFFGSARALYSAQSELGGFPFPSHIPQFYPLKSRKYEKNEIKLYDRIVAIMGEYLSDFAIASRAVQIPGENNKKLSREIISDTFYQVIKSSINLEKTNIPLLMKSSTRPFISIIFPCIVTNSRMLYFENADLGIMQQLKLEKLEKICKEVKKVIFLYQIPQNLRFEPSKYYGEPINYLFIPVFSHDCFVPEIEKLRKRIHAIKI